MTPSSAALGGKAEGAVILVGNPIDLQEFGELSDLPARFYQQFTGKLTETVSVKGNTDLDALLNNYEVVGIDLRMLIRDAREPADRRRYKINFAQQLAARRVIVLSVLRGWEPSGQRASVEIDAPSGRFVSHASDAPFVQWCENLLAYGVVAKFRPEPGTDKCWLRLTTDSSKESQENLATVVKSVHAIFALREIDGGLESSRFSVALAHDTSARLEAVFQDCVKQRERDGLSAVHAAWRDAVANMQPDVRSRSRIELAIIATRAFEPDDVRIIKALTAEANRTAPVRAWLMTERLRVADDARDHAFARHIWPDALAMLMARLSGASVHDSGGGCFAWRAVAFGPSFDDSRLESLRKEGVHQILREPSPVGTRPSIDFTGHLRFISHECTVVRPNPTKIEWDNALGDKKACTLASRELSENLWKQDYRTAGRDLAGKRAAIMRNDAGGSSRVGATTSAVSTVSEDADSRDPERLFSVAHWRRIHERPGMLCAFAEGVMSRTAARSDDLTAQRRSDWGGGVLPARSDIAVKRECTLQHAEDLDTSREFFISVRWRMLIGLIVALYMAFIALNLLRVLMLIKPGTVLPGIGMVLCAVVGAWAGAVLPAWMEKRAGRRAAEKLDNEIQEVNEQQQVNVKNTHAMLLEADKRRQVARRTALNRRTLLLANRAWTVVLSAENALGVEAARRLAKKGTSAHQDADRLAQKDRRVWRDHAYFRPAAALPESVYTDPLIGKELERIKLKFLERWCEVLDTEDRYCTGFLRARVLEALVRELSGTMASGLAEAVLELGERRFLVAATSTSADEWAHEVMKRIGTDSGSHAMLSVLDEGAGKRPRGEYRILRRRSELAKSVSSIIERRTTGAMVVDVNRLPFGAYGMVFNEVPAILMDDGRVCIQSGGLQ